MKYICTNKNLKIRSLESNKDYIMPTDITVDLLKYSRDKAIIRVNMRNYTVDRFMFTQWFKQV